MEQNIIIYNTPDGKASVSLFARNGSVWMNQNQLAELFATSKQNISLHIINILEENELKEISVVKDYLTTAADGKTCGIMLKMPCKKYKQKCLAVSHYDGKFAATVLTTLPVRTASQGESFTFIYFSKIIYLPGFSNSSGRFFYACN